MKQDMMTNFLKKRASLTPDRTAIYFGEEELSFQDLYQRSVNTAGQMYGQGIRKGQFVGVLLKNNLDTAVILFALQLLGVRTVILNNRLTTAELVWQLKDSTTSSLIVDDSFSEILPDIKEQIPSLSAMIKSSLFSSNFEEPIIQEEISLTEVCTIMYTSGTTGNPKGVMQTYGNHWWSAVGSVLNLGLTDSDCWLCTVPLFHISGFSILMRSVIYGMPVVLHEKFVAEMAIEAIYEKRVTIMSVVGTMLMEIVEALENRRLPDYFRCMLLGGGPAPLPLLQACVDKEIPVFQTYGMTETSSQIVTLAPEFSLTKLGSAGKPLFPAEIRIELENDQAAAAGQIGEIVVKGPNVTPGYLFQPDATKNIIRDGWLYTGDIGYLDEAGFLFVLDRRSDLIISGGENIYPAEIEAVLLSHSAVADAGVIGISDDKWGLVPAAFIVGRSPLTDEELKDFCEHRLAKYKVPKRLYFVDKLPRNAAKKLLRRTLREWLEEGRVNDESRED